MKIALTLVVVVLGGMKWLHFLTVSILFQLKILWDKVQMCRVHVS